MQKWLPAAAILVFGCVFAMSTPPFAVPDETAHWLHAVAASRQMNAWGPTETVRVPTAAIDFLDAYAPAGDPRKITTKPRFAITESAQKRELHLGTGSTYSALPYTFAIAGIAAARLLHLGTPASFWCGRIANMLCCAAIAIFAIRRAPGSRAWLTLIALLPMTVALRSSYSPDAMLIAGSILLGSYLAVPGAAPIPVIASAILVAIKAPYLPLALLSIALVRGVWQRVGVAALLISIAFIASSPGAHAQARLTGRAFTTIARSLAANAWEYTREMIGVLGWLDIPLPQWLYITTTAAAVVVLARTRSTKAAPHVAALVAIVATIGAIAIGIYVMWPHTEANVLAGLQGRYFLPVLPFAAVVMPSGKRIADDAATTAVVLFSSVSLVVALHAIALRFA